MVEEDAVACVDAVSLPVVLDDPESIQLGHTYIHQRRIESLGDFVMHQESPVYFGLIRAQVKTRIEQQAKSGLMADVYSLTQDETEQVTTDGICALSLEHDSGGLRRQ